MLRFIVFIILCGCSSSSYDGTYCAEIDRYNPSSQKESSYTLLVDVDENIIKAIHWPNGGYSDEDEIGSPIISSSTSSFSDNDNVQYKVKINGSAENCFEGMPPLKQCSGTREDGAQCKNKTGHSSGICHIHR